MGWAVLQASSVNWVLCALPIYSDHDCDFHRLSHMGVWILKCYPIYYVFFFKVAYITIKSITDVLCCMNSITLL